MPRQQVEMKSGSKTNNASEIGDNNNKQHISNQNEASQQQRNKRSRQQQQQLQSQHIYENLPVSATSQQLRKYFRREAIYENLCRGCGYGVFAAQGRYCHFCQCIVSGSVAAALQQQELPRPTPSQGSDCNIYENICELCRGIYSDSEQCKCASSTTPTATATATATATLTPPAPAQAAGKAVGKSRTLLGYSRSSAATLTRLFGSLKQLNRSGSLQRRLFQRETKPGSNAGSGGSSAGSGGSLEIIHNVDEVFRTQETFDMQRICELKQQRHRQLQCSRSDQHIYGRLRAEPTELQQVPAAEAKAEIEMETETEPDTQTELEVEIEAEAQAERDAGAQSRKKPRVSRMRLLQQPAQTAPSAQSALYLNESICQWMNALRRELHCYEDVNGGVGCQQPKSVPPAYEQERDREKEREREREREAELVTLRRSVSAEGAAAADTETATATAPALALQQQAVNEFKRKLLAKREQQQREQQQQQLELSDRSRRRCGINERHDAAFVTEFLSGLSAVAATTTTTTAITTTITIGTTTAVAAAQRISLGQMWQSAAIAASLNVSVICYFGYEKLLSAFLHGQRRQRLRLRSSDSDTNVERWLRRYRRLCESNNNNAERESASRWQRLRLRQRQRQILGPPLLELAVVPATPASDDVALARRVGSDSEAAAETDSESESGSGSGREARSVCGSERSSDSGSAAMAAPKQSGDAERSSCDDSENNKNNNSSNVNSSSNNNNNNSSNNNNNNSSSNNNNNNESSNVNCEHQQQQKAQDRVIKVRRPAPQVPMRNPSTALSKPRNGNILGNSNNDNNNDNDNNELQSAPKKFDMGKLTEEKQQQQQEEGEGEGDGEESIYQTIWQFRTREPVPDDADEDFEIITAAESLSDDDADDAEDDNDDDNVDADGDAAEAETLALQAAAAFAAGARHRLTKQTVTAAATATPTVTPLPSPTASMDHGAWETDDEFMFEKADAAQHAEGEREREQAETLSVGSTVTNSTATLGSISSAGSATGSSSGSGSISVQGATSNIPAPPPLLQHPLLRNICIIYSLEEPQKHRAIFYEYQRAQLYQRFMTRIRRPAPPPPTAVQSAPAPTATPNNDDSGCSCEADGEDMAEQIPQPLREEWVLALLASAASSKRGGVAAAGAAGRKTRVRSNARLEPMSPSVLAWRKQLQHVNCCEDEEDMIVPVTDILRAQQIQEDNEVQQSQQTTILQRYKSASSGNLVDIPGEDDKKSIRNRMRMKLNSNVFRLNRSPKSEKKTRSRRSQANSLCLDEQSKYPLFGARLNALELNMTDHPYVPRFVVDVCSIIEQPDAIEQDGLYRASGNKVLVDELKRKLTHLYDPRWLQTDDIHTLTSLHKQFFRELPAPLITQEAYERLGRSLTDDAAIERMRVAFEEMPDPNRSTLRFLIKHLTNVAAASASNRMPASNLAIVWGPCLLAANDINFDIGRMNMIAKVLIENYERIFRPANERLVC